MQQFMALLNAECRDQNVGRASRRYAKPTHPPIVACRGEGKLVAAQVEARQRKQPLADQPELPVGANALKHFLKYAVAECDRLLVKQQCHPIAMRGLRAPKEVNPYTCVGDDHSGIYLPFNLRSAPGSPSQWIFPRSARMLR